MSKYRKQLASIGRSLIKNEAISLVNNDSNKTIKSVNT